MVTHPRQASRLAAAALGTPIPWSILLTLLWVGLLRLAGFVLALAAPHPAHPDARFGSVFGRSGPAGATLLELVTAINLLFVAWLWVEYRARLRSTQDGRLVWRIAYLGAAALLFALTFAVWRLA